MAVTVGDAVVYYRGDNKDALRSMDETESKSRSWASRLGGIVKTGLIGGTLAVVGLSAAMGKLAFDAMPLEGISKAFQGITGDAEEALRALRKGSLGMVKDADLMMTYNNAAQLVGKSFADDLPEAMQYLAKVSAATGTDMAYLMDSLTKGIGRLSAPILDNLQIQVDATAANEVYAVSVGKSTDELTKQEQQTALMNQVMEKLAENTKDMPDITENASTKWAQLTTKFGNLKDMIGLKVLPIFTTVVTFISDTMLPTIERIGSFFYTAISGGEIFEDFFEGLPEAVEKPLVKLWEALHIFQTEGLGGLAQHFWDWLTGEYGVINAGVFLIQHRFIPQIKYQFGQMWPVIRDTTQQWAEDFWNWLTGEDGVLAKAKIELDALVTTITNWSTESSSKFQDIGSAIGQFIVDGVIALMGGEETDDAAAKSVILAFVESLGRALLSLDVAIAKAGADIGIGIAGKIAEAVGGPEAKKLITDKLNEMLKEMAVDVILGPWGLILKMSGIVPGYGIQGSGIPSMASGGTVPGPIGAPMPIIAHGGETITPAGETGANVTLQFNFNNGFSRQEANAAAGLTVDALRLHGVAI